MGVLRATLARLILYALAVAAAAASGIVLARKLTPFEYSVYQVGLRRGALYASAVLGPMLAWMYRDVRRGRGVEAAALAVALSSLVGLAVGAAAASLLGLAGLEAALLEASLALYGAWSASRMIVEARRPVRAGAVLLGQRLLFAGLVVVAVYLLRLGLAGAFTAAAAAYAAAAAAALWLSGVPVSTGSSSLSVVASWLRRAPAALPGSAATLVQASDAPLVYGLAGPVAVAGYLAATSLPRLGLEAVGQAALFIQGLGLTGGAGAAAASASLVSLLTAPLLSYAAVNPVHLVYLVNPSYSWASVAAAVGSIAAYVNAAALAALQLRLGALSGEGEARGIAALSGARLAASLALLAGAAVSASLARSPGGVALGWALSWLASGAALLAYLSHGHPEARLAAGRSLLYLALGVAASLASSLLLPLPAPSPRFWREALILAEGFIPAAAVYAIIVASVDPWARGLLRRLPALLEAPAWRR